MFALKTTARRPTRMTPTFLDLGRLKGGGGRRRERVELWRLVTRRKKNNEVGGGGRKKDRVTLAWKLILSPPPRPTTQFGPSLLSRFSFSITSLTNPWCPSVRSLCYQAITPVFIYMGKLWSPQQTFHPHPPSPLPPLQTLLGLTSSGRISTKIRDIVGFILLPSPQNRPPILPNWAIPSCMPGQWAADKVEHERVCSIKLAMLKESVAPETQKTPIQVRRLFRPFFELQVQRCNLMAIRVG